MLHRLTTVFLLFGLAHICTACNKPKSDNPAPSTAQKTLDDNYGAASKKAISVSSMFPESLNGYTRKFHKTKKKDWGNAHSATYKKGDDELKVVVNDAPPEGRKEWATFFKDGKTYKDYPVALDAKPGKITLMVRVGKRFRVDFKTRTMTEDTLRNAADGFDFKAVEKVAE